MNPDELPVVPNAVPDAASDAVPDAAPDTASDAAPDSVEAWSSEALPPDDFSGALPSEALAMEALTPPAGSEASASEAPASEPASEAPAFEAFESQPGDSKDGLGLVEGSPDDRSPIAPLPNNLASNPASNLASNPASNLASNPASNLPNPAQLSQEVAELEQRRDALQAELEATQVQLTQVVRESLQDLRERRQTLKLSIEQLERKKDRVQTEIRQSFSGTSQDMAVRVQGFKDYLVGSLQDLAATAEALNLPGAPAPKFDDPVPSLNAASPASTARSGRQAGGRSGTKANGKGASGKDPIPAPQFATQSFEEQARQIRKLLDRYRTAPDYYGPAWQLRRTFEPIHAERVASWFFEQGGRGAVRTLGSRLQNILISSAVISVLNHFYGERLCALVLANSPERLGDWRRGLQECLGVARTDFGPNQGIVLCESPEILAQRAERLLENEDLPLIIMDEAEEYVSVSLLQFPLWLAFAPDPTRAKGDRADGGFSSFDSGLDNSWNSQPSDKGNRMGGSGNDRAGSNRAGNDRAGNDRLDSNNSDWGFDWNSGRDRNSERSPDRQDRNPPRKQTGYDDRYDRYEQERYDRY